MGPPLMTFLGDPYFSTDEKVQAPISFSFSAQERSRRSPMLSGVLKEVSEFFFREAR
jgi:hypothetical protein